jgi:hypothetical protein
MSAIDNGGLWKDGGCGGEARVIFGNPFRFGELYGRPLNVMGIGSYGNPLNVVGAVSGYEYGGVSIFMAEGGVLY